MKYQCLLYDGALKDKLDQNFLIFILAGNKFPNKRV